MLKMCRFLLISVATVFLTACAPIPQPAKNQPHATVRGWSAGGFFNRSGAVITSVNGVFVGGVSSIRITPGFNQLKIDAFFSKSKGMPSAEAILKLRFTAKIGGEYVVMAKFDGKRIYAWVQTEAGSVVSAKVSADYYPVGTIPVKLKAMPR